MDQAEGRRWSKIIGQAADALEASRPSPAISRKIVERAAVDIVLADEIAEVDELLQQFAEAVKMDFIARYSCLISKRTARWTHKSH